MNAKFLPSSSPCSPRRRQMLGFASLAPMLLIAPDATSSEGLVSRPIPGSTERLPVVGLGTWQTFDVGGNRAARAPLKEVLRIMGAAGARTIDSSPMYGTSEAVAGSLMAELGMRDRLFVATKVWTSGRVEGIRQMQRSMKRLQVEQVDLMQVHNLVDLSTHVRTLAQWKERGLIRHLGISHYTASAYADVERALLGGKFGFLQINYSLAEREAERRLLPLAMEKGLGVLVNRPFAEGALLRRVRDKPLPGWAAEAGASTWPQLLLKWILGHPAVTCVIPGTGKPQHMKDNLSAGLEPLPDRALRERIAGYFDAL